MKYPRHRTLISINKFNTGTGNPEFNLRHDWNSLLDDEGFRFPERYSSDFWPDADDLVDYIGGFTQEHKLNVQYHTDVTQVADAEGCAQNPALPPPREWPPEHLTSIATRRMAVAFEP